MIKSRESFRKYNKKCKQRGNNKKKIWGSIKEIQYLTNISGRVKTENGGDKIIKNIIKFLRFKRVFCLKELRK